MEKNWRLVPISSLAINHLRIKSFSLFRPKTSFAVNCQLLACFVLLTFYLPVITIHIGTNNSNFHKIKETCYTKKCLVQSFNSFLQPLQPSILMTMLDELVDKFSFLTWRYPKQGSSCSSHALAPSFNF